MDATSKTDIDELVGLAHAGAVQASEAFALLAGHPVAAIEPVVSTAELGAESGEPDAASPCAPEAAADVGSTGVFFEFDGCLEAVVGIVFPAEASDRVVRRIVGMESGELEATIVESALMEVGNILASHVASAIADRLGSRLLPSIPSLAMRDAEHEFEVFLGGTVGSEVTQIESRLEDESGGLLGRLILVPSS